MPKQPEYQNPSNGAPTRRTPPPQRGPLGGGGPPGHGMHVGEKAKDFSGSLKKLFAYAKAYVPVMAVAILLAICSSIFSLMGPSRLSAISDLILEGMMTGIDTAAVASIATFLLAIYILSLVFGYVQSSIMAVVAQKLCKQLRKDLVQKLNHLPLSYFDTRSYGDTLSYITNDVDTVSVSLTQSMSTVISGLFLFAGALILMFYTNWIMAASALVAAMGGFMLMALVIGNSQRFFKAQQEELGALNGHIEESYTGHTVLKAYNGEALAMETFNEGNARLFNAAWKAQFLSGLMMPIMQFVGNFAYVVVCIVGAVLTLQGVISFGVIVAFMIYVRLFTQPLANLSQAATTLQSAAAAAERVFELLEEEELPEEESDLVEKTNLRGDVTFSHVNFGYTKEKQIIKDFSAEVKAGQKVAIVGPTGAGKTTIVNLLMRFYEVDSGEILLDGTPIRKMKRENLHDMFAMVLQDTWMFEGTIKANIAYSQSDVSDEEIVAACKAVGIHHTIKTMPKGYDTVMSNATLSVGEKQLLTIARAMVKKSELLILDEATSSVDTRTELLIGRAMDKLSKDKTSFIIAHRLSTIKNADLILVMKDGNIVEKGNHEELLAQGGFYATLYNSQFDDVAS